MEIFRFYTNFNIMKNLAKLIVESKSKDLVVFGSNLASSVGMAGLHPKLAT
jgi:hypothetical protein